MRPSLYVPPRTIKETDEPATRTISMPSLDAVRKSNANVFHRKTPVALFLGGTSGIGRATAQAFARHTKGNAHIIIIGRNRAAAEAAFKTFPAHTNSKYEFIYCDVGLVRNITEVTRNLLVRLHKVNYMVLTCGALPSLWDTLRGVTSVTEEGISASLQLPYYARVKFLLDLLPLIQKTLEAHEDARVLSVAIAGFGGPINYDDMGLLKTYSAKTFRPTLATYTDAAMEVSVGVLRNRPVLTCTRSWVPVSPKLPSRMLVLARWTRRCFPGGSGR